VNGIRGASRNLSLELITKKGRAIKGPPGLVCSYWTRKLKPGPSSISKYPNPLIPTQAGTEKPAPEQR